MNNAVAMAGMVKMDRMLIFMGFLLPNVTFSRHYNSWPFKAAAILAKLQGTGETSCRAGRNHFESADGHNKEITPDSYAARGRRYAQFFPVP
jgi:hypothetical protein